MKSGRKEIEYLDYILPTRKSIRKMVAEFSLICYKDIAESIVNANANGQTVSYGSENTIKVARNKKINIKTAKITINSSKKERESFSSGFYPNACHRGLSPAQTIMHDTSKMAFLTNIIYEDMQSIVDIFMNDEQRILKCRN